ncbi:MAG TPA: C4-type zinc ribbon domain-containing protein [Tepidisphaeraceae bacterium]|nr:C4-type zinc ribbon domain-containing protein [Tepidisphaeraceae bacterium]
MGPTNVALVKLYQADQKLREAQGRLEATTKNVRIQERRVRDLSDRIAASSAQLRTEQARGGSLDLDLKSRDAHIEKLRTQQQSAKTNKEYQAFLVEINTGKVDRNKVEEEALKVLDGVEKLQAEIKELNVQLEGEKAKLATLQSQITEKTADLQREIDQIRPERDAAAAALPAKARDAFDRIADRFEGEVLAPIVKPDRRLEEYTCAACMMDLVRDVYNRLHTRDELVFCPSCRRILYIPEDLTPELAVHKPKEKKPRAVKAPPAATNRQTSAVDVLRSIQVEEDEPAEAATTELAATPDGGAGADREAVTSSSSSSSQEPAATHDSPAGQTTSEGQEQPAERPPRT